MTSAIDLNPNHLDIVERILAEHVPGCEVRAFGSRAAWTARDYSDVDLAVVGDGPLHWRTLSRLREAFEESRLPMRVDVLDWNAISEGFREAIKSDCVVLQKAAVRVGWREVALGEVVKNFDSRRVPLSRHVRAGRPGPYPYYGATGVLDYLDDYLFEGLHLLVGEDGSVETAAGTPFLQLVDGKFWVNNHAHVLRGADDDETRYLYYALSMVPVRPFMSGSVQAKLSQTNLNKIPVPYFTDAAERRAVVRVLGALDDKIELNGRMSETIEEMARALFRSWFVDFDPVRAKAEGRPSGLPPDLDALFPASLVPSELGEIPGGWEVRRAGDAMSVYGGSTPSTREPTYWGGHHYFATPKDMSLLQEPILASTARRLTDAGVARIRSGLVPAGTVLLSSRAPIGYLAVTEMPVAINQGIIAMVCDGPVGASYALHWSHSNMHAIETRASGTTFAEISKSSFREIPFLVPPAPVHAAWESLLTPLYRLVASNARRSRSLAAQRDALLPQLVAGELRLGAA